MEETKMVFKRETGNKKKDNIQLEVDEEIISLQKRQENTLIISFKSSEDETMNIYQFFDDFDELEPVLVNIADAGDVQYYLRGISPQEKIGGNEQKFSVTLQLRRE
jgi:hypothetical protein